ncbi:hypothetical protein BDV59DRAFT_70624 [Aspergillus ambiguus]|uniref:Zn(II)2Cys6 transcription factor domain-containing protein n=1 Tax=Aspergillus ambiguus TaxID=176160 RepID=UPI003CCCCDB4
MATASDLIQSPSPSSLGRCLDLMPPRKKKTCQTCKARKIRCDGHEPTCHRCLKSHRNCAYATKPAGTIAFRHSKLSALVSVAREPDRRTSIPSWLPEQQALISQSPVSPFNSPGQGPQLQLSPVALGPSPELYTSPGIVETPSIPRSLPYAVSQPTEEPPLFYRSPPLSLTSVEGELLHFYVQNIGPWLDVTSPERHYTYSVPRLALQCLLLHTAIMACAAHVLRLLDPSRVDLASEEEKYQSKCVGLLIPILNDVASAVQDEAVLATIVILRMSEQYAEYDVDRQYHLVPGAFAHLGPSVRSSTATGGLLQATFYSYVRADIRMALLGQRSTRISVDSWPLDESSPFTDADWANRITWLLVHTINLCYGQDIHGVLSFGELSNLIDEWKRTVPSTFSPYFYEQKPRETFPTIRLICPWHVVGLQFYHTAKIMLAAHCAPEGTYNNAVEFNRYLERNILPHVWHLCGISFSNEHFGCRINSSHCVAMGARFLNGRHDQWLVQEHFNTLQNKKNPLQVMSYDLFDKDCRIPI